MFKNLLENVTWELCQILVAFYVSISLKQKNIGSSQEHIFLSKSDRSVEECN